MKGQPLLCSSLHTVSCESCCEYPWKVGFNLCTSWSRSVCKSKAEEPAAALPAAHPQESGKVQTSVHVSAHDQCPSLIPDKVELGALHVFT